jgi:hypothetical protein
MKQDDALEMFVRFNSGGKALKKHEITMSILEAYWPNAKTEFGKLLDGSYAGFGSDFIVRSALMLYGDVVKSNINNHLYIVVLNLIKKALCTFLGKSHCINCHILNPLLGIINIVSDFFIA